MTRDHKFWNSDMGKVFVDRQNVELGRGGQAIDKMLNGPINKEFDGMIKGNKTLIEKSNFNQMPPTRATMKKPIMPVGSRPERVAYPGSTLENKEEGVKRQSVKLIDPEQHNYKGTMQIRHSIKDMEIYQKGGIMGKSLSGKIDSFLAKARTVGARDKQPRKRHEGMLQSQQQIQKPQKVYGGHLKFRNPQMIIDKLISIHNNKDAWENNEIRFKNGVVAIVNDNNFAFHMREQNNPGVRRSGIAFSSPQSLVSAIQDPNFINWYDKEKAASPRFYWEHLGGSKMKKRKVVEGMKASMKKYGVNDSIIQDVVAPTGFHYRLGHD